MQIESIPFGLPFLKTLAQELASEYALQPIELAKVSVILPTRRSCRVLKNEFTQWSKTAKQTIFLPKILVISDLIQPSLLDSEMSTALGAGISYDARFGLLMQLVKGQLSKNQNDRKVDHHHAVQLTQALIELIDEMHTESADFEKITSLVPEDYSEHWKESLEFLRIISQFWPAILQDKTMHDHKALLNHGIQALIDKWKTNPTPYPVVMAGVTGSFPQARKLICEVARLNHGRVILSGFDHHLQEDAFEDMTPAHPQYVYKNLLDDLKIDANQIKRIGDSETTLNHQNRLSLLSKSHENRLHAIGEAGLEFDEKLGLIECDSLREEALTVALLIRQGIEDPQKKIALITPHRPLADMVKTELLRWDIVPDDSAGYALIETALGAYFLLLNAVCLGRFSAASFLSLLKHPMTLYEYDSQHKEALCLMVEMSIFRQPLSPQTFDDFCARCESDLSDNQQYDALSQVLIVIKEYRQYLRGSYRLEKLVRAHESLMNGLALGVAFEEYEEKQAFDDFLQNLKAASSDFGELAAQEYSTLISQLMSRHIVRQPQGYHSRVFVLGPMEARLQHFDRVIVAGVNEGIWPREKEDSPWLSRNMRRELGLPDQEQYIGFSALDFYSACAMEEVIITRTTKAGGAGTIPSRWVARLKICLDQLNSEQKSSPFQEFVRIAAQLAKEQGPIRIQQPCPMPPVHLRPRRLSVTDIEKLIRDPYQIYCKHILKIRPLNDLDVGLENTAFGNLIHNIFETFVKTTVQQKIPHTLEHLIEEGKRQFVPLWSYPMVKQFWWPQFVNIAEWFYQQDLRQREISKAHHVEIQGTVKIQSANGPFTVFGKADRIDVLNDHSLEVIDYKTGMIPTMKDVEQGIAIQLPLEGMIATWGGFSEIQSGMPVSVMSYWVIKGRYAGNERVELKKTEILSEQIETIIQDLAEQYDKADTKYTSIPRPEIAPTYNDYEHLSRIKEWDN